LQLNHIDIPASLVDAEAEKLYQQTAKNLSKNKGAESIPPPKEEFYEIAKDRVQLGLLFAEFIRSRNIQVDSSQVLQTLQQVAAPYKDPEAIIAWYRSNPEQLNQINMAVLEEQVINELVKQVKLVDKVISHQEFLNQRKT
jgi:trigger factor